MIHEHRLVGLRVYLVFLSLLWHTGERFCAPYLEAFKGTCCNAIPTPVLQFHFRKLLVGEFDVRLRWELFVNFWFSITLWCSIGKRSGLRLSKVCLPVPIFVVSRYIHGYAEVHILVDTSQNLLEVALHVKPQHLADQPKAIAWVLRVTEILHHIDSRLLVQIDGTRCLRIIVQRVLETSVRNELHTQVVMENVKPLTCPVQNLNFNIHSICSS